MPNPPMNPANYMIAMIDAYIHWLNEWAKTDVDLLGASHDDVHAYTVQQFTMYDPPNNLYGHAEFIAMTPMLWDCFLVQAVISDGDEGGSHELLAWFDIDTVNGTNAIRDMVQGFDTSRQFIMSDGRYTNLPN